MKMADRVGQRIDRYRLTRLIGQGEFGEVYLGKHLRYSNQVAIKVFNTQLTKVDKKDFDTTGRIIKQLEHKNLVQVLDFGDEEGIPFLIMDYFPNGSLRQRYPKG